MSKKPSDLGKSLIKDHKRKSHFVINDGYRHNSDLNDGRDWARLNLLSVTEQSSLDDFLDKAELAANEYEAEFSNIKIVESDIASGILTDEERLLVNSAQEKNKNMLCIPRRPFWDQNTCREELESKEKEIFLEWRRNLSKIQEEEHINLTPYEKNLEIWRQLWRVIERSDVLVQIIDARNPLLFRCPDLEVYVKEVDSSKLNVLLLNKADFLTESERKCWCEFFESAGIKIVFFSALQQMESSPEECDSTVESDQDETISHDEEESKSDVQQMEKPPEECDSTVESDQNETISNEEEKSKSDVIDDQEKIKNSTKVLSREELTEFLKKIGSVAATKKPSVIGLVGYPNVGKSSTVNALLMSKKVSVSATPGKTKHFQTHIIDEDLCLCDCPGLVFPNFVSTKAEMVINGILPIDQLTNWVQPISLVTNLIPRNVLEATYNIIIPLPEEGRDPKSPPTAEEFLNAYGYNRGLMTQRALPDNARSSRYVLKDFVNGKLLFCHAPPGMKQEDYHKFEVSDRKKKSAKASAERLTAKEIQKIISEADRKFFMMESCSYFTSFKSSSVYLMRYLHKFLGKLLSLDKRF